MLFNDMSARFNRWRAYRETRKELSSLTARELDDLGIAPFEIDAVARRSVR
ncbi:MAG: DUF1127 domain-containing protein [Pseudomonadota bacterium]